MKDSFFTAEKKPNDMHDPAFVEQAYTKALKSKDPCWLPLKHILTCLKADPGHPTHCNAFYDELDDCRHNNMDYDSWMQA